MKKLWKYLSTLGLMFVALLCLGVGLKTSGFLFATDSGDEPQIVPADGGTACVYIANGKHEMKGGTIGGKTYGIYISGGTFTMSGGTISNCSSYGVYISGGTFNYSAGTISNEIYLSSSKYITLTKAPTSTLKIVSSSTAVGTKIAKLSGITTIDTSKLSVSGLPAGRRLEVQTISSEKWVVIATAKSYTLTIDLGDGAGTFSYNNTTFTSKSFTITEGTTITYSSSPQKSITFDSNTIVFTPNTSVYTFVMFQYTMGTESGYLTSITVSNNVKITPFGQRNGYRITLLTNRTDAYWCVSATDTQRVDFLYVNQTYITIEETTSRSSMFVSVGGGGSALPYCSSGVAFSRLESNIAISAAGGSASTTLSPSVYRITCDITITAYFGSSFIADEKQAVMEEEQATRTKEERLVTLTESDYTIRRKQRASK